MTATCTNCGSPLPAGANYCPKCGSIAVGQPVTGAPRTGMPKWLVGVLIGCAVLFVSLPVIAIVAAIFIPNFIHARDESSFAQDENNLKQIATAVEQYGVDHSGKYPDNLPELVPTYMPKLPVVPGGDNTGAYDYHHPASMQPGAGYEIWDDGSMAPSTMASLTLGVNGAPCRQSCKYVVYVAGVGIVGVPGQSR
jgi:zinc ribbon protein